MPFFPGNALEIGALWSIAVKDIPSFERYIAMLKIYYMDYRQVICFRFNYYELVMKAFAA